MKIFKKKLIAPVFLFAVIAGILGSCSDSFLTITPQSALSASSLNTQAGVDAALIGVYAMLDGYNIDNNNTWPSDPVNWIMGSITTDDAVKGSEQGDGPENTQLELYQWTTTNVQLDGKYRPMYEGVARANNTINLLKATTGLDQGYHDNVLGQALMLRAHFHFELYKVFGAIIFVNDDDAAKSNFKKKNEATPAAALALIVADMEQAVSLLPATQTDIGRVNLRAAQAYLGKLYMYQLQYAKAETMLQNAINGIPLANCQRDLFTYATENSPEALFSVQMSLSNKDQARNSNWLNQLANPVGGGFGCCGFHQPKQSLVNAFHTDANGLPLLGTSDPWLDDSNNADVNFTTDNVDPRLDLVVGRDGVPYWDWAVHNPSFIRSRAYSGPYSPKKMQPYSTSPIVSGGWNGASNNGVNVPVIRSADAMLLLAEAEVELNKLDAAQTLVNAIRKRAGNCAQGGFVHGAASGVITSNLHDPAITWANYKVSQYPAGAFTSGGLAYARKAVRMERRLELAMEGHRLFDIRRWDDMEPGYFAKIIDNSQRLEKCCGKTGIDQITGARNSYYNDAVPVGPQHRWYPFPFVEVQLSTSNGQPTLTQNAGY
jgi:hypothetical protein